MKRGRVCERIVLNNEECAVLTAEECCWLMMWAFDDRELNPGKHGWQHGVRGTDEAKNWEENDY